MPKDLPANSTPELDFVRRMRIRNDAFAGVAFLYDDEKNMIDAVLGDAITQGITPEVARRTHAALVFLKERDSSMPFLDDTERGQLDRLINPDLQSKEPNTKAKKSKPKSKPVPVGKNIGAGETLAAIGIILSGAAATLLTFQDPHTASYVLWVGFWGVIFGGGLIRDTRRRNLRENERTGMPAGLIVSLIWAIAAVAVVVVGGSSHLQLPEELSPSWAAFLGFLGAGIISRGILGMSDDDD